MSMWKHVGEGGTCECGSKDQVIKYKHADTGEVRRLCVNCEEAAAAVRGVSR